MRAMPLVFAVVYLIAAAAASAGPGPGPGPGAGAGPVRETAAAPAPAAVRRIRPRDTVAALFLRFGNEKSARFREVVRALEHSNVIVYVEVRQDSNHPVSGGLTFIGEAHGIRWVRAMVDSGTSNHLRTCQDIVRLTSILGHELQHALEASQAPTMRNVRPASRWPTSSAGWPASAGPWASPRQTDAPSRGGGRPPASAQDRPTAGQAPAPPSTRRRSPARENVPAGRGTCFARAERS
jgi:hypothetical protein